MVLWLVRVGMGDPPPPPPPRGKKFSLEPVFFDFFSGMSTWGPKTKLTLSDQINQISPPPIVKHVLEKSSL